MSLCPTFSLPSLPVNIIVNHRESGGQIRRLTNVSVVTGPDPPPSAGAKQSTAHVPSSNPSPADPPQRLRRATCRPSSQARCGFLATTSASANPAAASSQNASASRPRACGRASCLRGAAIDRCSSLRCRPRASPRSRAGELRSSRRRRGGNTRTARDLLPLLSIHPSIVATRKAMPHTPPPPPHTTQTPFPSPPFPSLPSSFLPSLSLLVHRFWGRPYP